MTLETCYFNINSTDFPLLPLNTIFFFYCELQLTEQDYKVSWGVCSLTTEQLELRHRPRTNLLLSGIFGQRLLPEILSPCYWSLCTWTVGGLQRQVVFQSLKKSSQVWHKDLMKKCDARTTNKYIRTLFNISVIDKRERYSCDKHIFSHLNKLFLHNIL